MFKFKLDNSGCDDCRLNEFLCFEVVLGFDFSNLKEIKLMPAQTFVKVKIGEEYWIFLEKYFDMLKNKYDFKLIEMGVTDEYIGRVVENFENKDLIRVLER